MKRRGSGPRAETYLPSVDMTLESRGGARDRLAACSMGMTHNNQPRAHPLPRRAGEEEGGEASQRPSRHQG